jgi:hypothetical protein
MSNTSSPIRVHKREVNAVYYAVFVEIRRRVRGKPHRAHNAPVHVVYCAVGVACSSKSRCNRDEEGRSPVSG